MRGPRGPRGPWRICSLQQLPQQNPVGGCWLSKKLVSCRSSWTLEMFRHLRVSGGFRAGLNQTVAKLWPNCDTSGLPSGELTFCNGKSPFWMGKSTISMAIFNSQLLVHQGVSLAVTSVGHKQPQLFGWEQLHRFGIEPPASFFGASFRAPKIPIPWDSFPARPETPFFGWWNCWSWILGPPNSTASVVIRVYVHLRWKKRRASPWNSAVPARSPALMMSNCQHVPRWRLQRISGR